MSKFKIEVREYKAPDKNGYEGYEDMYEQVVTDLDLRALVRFINEEKGNQ